MLYTAALVDLKFPSVQSKDDLITGHLLHFHQVTRTERNQDVAGC